MHSLFCQNRASASKRSSKAFSSDVPAPKAPTDDILRALVFDSHYDTYRGVMVYVRMISGEITKKSMIRMMATGQDF